MKRALFDIETNELLRKLTRRWITVAYDLDAKCLVVWYEGDSSWMAVFDQLELLVGHNILGFDLPALEKLDGYHLPDTVVVHDTLLMSQVLNYRRFGHDGHSLETWGDFLGKPKHAKPDFENPDMLVLEAYCKQDVLLNVDVYEILLKEFFALYDKAPQIAHYLRAEHYTATWCATAELYGWPFDMENALSLFDILDSELKDIRAKLEPRLGMKAVATDKKKGEVEEKKPKWTKQGFYDVHTARWFGVDPCSGFEGEERLILGPYCRVEFVHLKLSSTDDVKLFLSRNGWEPSEWNYKKDPVTHKKVKTSPKIVEEDLELLGGDGKLYKEFNTAESRYSIVKTWIENVDEHGNLHGECFTIGTPSMRARHSIIVNVPRAKSKWGKEMRALFKCEPGWKLIGCDSSGNQARGLAHYLGNQEYIDLLLHGDVHQYNANILTEIVEDINPNLLKLDLPTIRDGKVDREAAKRILYAFLFGAQGPKLWSYIFGKSDGKLGTKLRNGFLQAVPGFAALLEKLENIFGSTQKFGYGYIPSLAGNRIYVDSFHKLLVYLLQAAEKITCSSALMFAVKQLKAEGIPYKPCIMMHDEIDFQVPEEYAERAAIIGASAFKEAPKLYGVTIMDGSGKIGNSWYEVH